MNVWTIKRIAVVSGLSALAVSAALAVDQGASMAAATPVIPGGGIPAARVTTSTTALFASPTVHATENGKCVKSSPDC